MNKTLRFGWAEKDITPEKPVSLRGQFYRRISEYVHSPLSVTVLAIETELDQAVICSCDLCGITKDVVEQVRENLQHKIKDLDKSKIIISATHTHTAPEFDLNPKEGFYDLYVAAQYLPEDKKPVVWKESTDIMSSYDYGIFLVKQITDAIEEAWTNRKPGFFSPQFARAVTGHCRRITYTDGSAKMYGRTDVDDFYSLEGRSDSGIELIYIFNNQKNLSGVVVNVACPSQVVEHMNIVSSDYWSAVRCNLKNKFGDNIFILPQCSAAGDQSPRDLVRRFKDIDEPSMFDFEGLIEIGKRISDAVIDKFDKAVDKMKNSAEFVHKTINIDFPIRTVTDSEYQKAKEAFNDYVINCKKERFESPQMAALHCAAGIMKRYEVQKTYPVYSAEIHIIRLGNIAFATNPFELFLDFGLCIKSRSKADQTFIIQLSSDTGKYLPTEKAEKGGHYSAVVASGYTGHEGGELLVGKTLETIDIIWQSTKDISVDK